MRPFEIERTVNCVDQKEKIRLLCILLVLIAGSLAIVRVAERMVIESRRLAIARKFIMRAIKAYGGRQNMFVTASRTLEYNNYYVLPFRSVEHVTKYEKGAAELLLQEYGGLQTKTYHDARGGWIERDGVVSVYSGMQNSLQDPPQPWSPRQILLDAASPHSNVILLDPERLPDGVEAAGIRVKYPAGEQRDLWFAGGTGLIAAMDYPDASETNPLRSRQMTLYRQYQQVGRTRVAFENSVYENGNLQRTTIYSRNDVLTPISDGLFSSPPSKTIEETTELPFDYSAKRPYVKISVNGSKAQNFLVDTGAEFTVLSPAFAKQLHLPFSATINSNSRFSSIQARITKLSQMHLGGVVIRDITALVEDESFKDDNTGLSYAGILGYNVLGRAQVSLNYKTRIMTLHPRLYTTLPAACRVPLHVDQGHFWVEAVSDSHHFSMAVDTGSVSTYFPPESSWLRKTTRVLKSGWITFATGDKLREYACRVPRLEIGSQTVFNLPVFFLEPKAITELSEYFSVLGNSVLERFKVTFDYAHSRLFLEPNSVEYPDPWTYPGVDLAYDATTGAIVVKSLYPGSPSLNSGIQLGDHVVSIDGKSTAGISDYRLYWMLRGPVGSNVDMTVQRGEQFFKLKLLRTRLF